MKRFALALLILSPAACLDVGGAPMTGISGRVDRGPGIVFFEKGHVQQGEFQLAAEISADGRFEIDLDPDHVGDRGGPWGVHLYMDNFFYLPLEVEVEEGYVTPIIQPNIAWQIVRQGAAWTGSGMQPPDPGLLAMIPDDNLADNPMLANWGIEDLGGGAVRAAVDIVDPTSDLSRQELLFHVPSGVGVQMNGPAPPVNDNFPNGRYEVILYDLDPAGPWYFVAADHGCSNSPVVNFVP